MQILIVAATQAEIQPLLDSFSPRFPCDVLITGVGMVATAFAMGNRTNIESYDLIINLGIAGSFDRNITLGEVVEVVYDELSELGAEDGKRFIPISELGFGESTYDPIADLADYFLRAALKKVKAITVNTVHGDEDSITAVHLRTGAQLESMEGAAFFYACQKLGKPGLQIRVVSNYVERRNRNNWKIGLAIKNLNNFAIALIQKLTEG